jgi:hypothetical protein
MKNAVKDSGREFSCTRGEPCQRSSRRGTPSGSPVDGSDEAKRKGVLLANACGSGAKDDHLASASGALRDGCDHLDAVTLSQFPIQTVTVIGFVADQSRREGLEEAVSEDAFDELAFVRRSAFDTNGERKTVIIGESDDFRSLAAFSRPNREAPFFAPVKEASMKASSSCSFPRACNSSAKVRKMRSNLPSRTHCWKRRWQVWYGGYFLGSSRHCAPVPKTHKTPLRTARVSCHGRPRPSERRFGRKIGSISCHWASLSSHRPRMPSFCLFFYTQKIAK